MSLRIPLLLAALSLVPLQALHALPGSFDLKDTPKPLRVDARLKDWPESRVFLMDRRDFVSEGRGFWRDPSQGSAKIYLTYDTEHLYLAAVVMQDHPPLNSKEGASLWNGDCVELMLSTRDGSAEPFFSKGDVHLGLVPGDGAERPRAWRFDLDREPAGVRVAARKTRNGYLLEAAIPWAQFGGVEVAPERRVRLNVVVGFAGAVTGDRTFSLDLTGKPRSWRNPETWPLARFIGSARVSTPPAADWDAGVRRVVEGTKRATLLSVAEITGRVSGPQGEGLSGFRIRTWPRSSETVSGPDGTFRLSKPKVYDRSWITAERDGYRTARRPLKPGASPVMETGPWPVNATEGGLLFLPGSVPESSPVLPGVRGIPIPEDPTGWDRLAKESFAGPVVWQVDVTRHDPAGVAELVRRSRAVAAPGTSRWLVSYSGRAQGGLDPYELVNEFRQWADAFHAVDPAILVSGPDLPLLPSLDWLSPLLRYDSDILDVLAVRFEPETGGVVPLIERRWDLNTAMRRLQYVVGSRAGRRIPIILVGSPASRSGEAPEGVRRPVLWASLLALTAAREGASLALPALEGKRSEHALLPGYLDLAERLDGVPIPCGSSIDGLEVLALASTRRPGEMNLFIVNLEGRDDRRLSISLGEKRGDVWMDLGTRRRLEEDLPGYGILRLTMDRDGRIRDRRITSASRPR